MYLKVIHALKGIVQIQLTGFSPERFFNLCSSGGIEIWNLVYREGTYWFCMTLPDFFKIRAYARKANVRLRVTEKRGLPFFMNKNRKRKLYGLGFISFFVLLYTLSLFIWDITFVGNYHYTDNTLTKFLNEQGIACGILKRGIDCDELEGIIRTYFPEITWVSARVSGTRLIIQVKENEVLSSIEKAEEIPCDIVADSAGTITYMIVRSGVPMVSVGDNVEQGQILISGTVPVTNDSEEVVGVNLVAADGDIRARSVYSYRKTFPLLHTVITDTGRVKKGLMVKAGNFTARLLLPDKKDTLWRTVTEEHQLKLFGDFYLPVWWGEVCSREAVSYERYYTKEEIEAMGNEIHEIFLHNLSEKRVQIIENNVKILEDASLCHVEGEAIAEGPVGRPEEILNNMAPKTDNSPED